MADYPFHYDPPKVRISDAEIVVQKACLRMIPIFFPRSRAAAVPNGQKRTRWQQQRAKAEGMAAGFTDMLVIGPAGITEGLFTQPGRTAFIEVKALAPLTPEQRDWLDFLHACGHHCGVFRSDRTLELKLREWGFQ
jgi:hypothetical protein